MNTQLKIWLLLALTGILLLLFLSQHLEPGTASISNITEKNLDQQVKIEGKITEIREYNNKTFQVLTIQDNTGSITAIADSKSGLSEKINKSLNYAVIGKVQEYNSTLQINIKKILLLTTH